MKSVYTVGESFPRRLKRALLVRNLRPSAIERAGLVSEDTITRWTRGEVFPEVQSFFNLARHMGLSSQQAAALLREPGEPVLTVVTKAQVRLDRFFEQCDRMQEKGLPALDAAEAKALAKRLNRLAEAARERAKECDSTTTERGSVSSTT